MTMAISTAGFIIVSATAIVIFIILTLLPMSLILVLKLAISRTESAISPVAKFCTTWWTHQPPTEFLFSRVFLLTSELCAFVFCFYYEAWVQNWLKMIRLGEKNYATYSPRPIHRSSFPGWLGNPRGIFFVRLIYMLVRVVLLAMRFCMFCICHILHVRTFSRRKISEKTFKACQH